MQINSFPEANHSLIQSLFDYSDQELLTLFQNHPDQGKYFTAIFCRYGQLVYTLIVNAKRSPSASDYLFAITWRDIFYEMPGLALGEGDLDSLQNWLIYMSAVYTNRKDLPIVDVIDYDLKTTSPPLWCYLEQALNTLTPLIRFILVMSAKFHWSLPRITAYLQAEGENISPIQVEKYLYQGYQLIQAALPEDIQIIYFGEVITSVFSSGKEVVGY